MDDMIGHVDIPSSQLTRLLAVHSSDNDSSNQYLMLALQIKHNLQHQHRWTELQIHQVSPITGAQLDRPLLSGLPPRRLYVNPDEQVDLVRRETEARKLKNDNSADSTAVPQLEDEFKLYPELEWVVPAHLREEWSLRRFGNIFDSIGPVPPSSDPSHIIDESALKWRAVKRALLATVQDDSTIVYYFVHDGIVKPRQN